MFIRATRACVPVSPMGLPSDEGYSMPSSRSRLGFREVLVETGTLMRQAPIAGYRGDSGSMSVVPSIVTEDTGPATSDFREAQRGFNPSSRCAFSTDGASKALGSNDGKVQPESMARGRDHGFQGFDLHDVEERDGDQPFGDILWVSRASQADLHPTPANHCQLGMHDVVGPTVRERQAERSKRLTSQEFTNIFRSHRCSPTLWSALS